jgi:hypothetical protein
LITQNIHYDVKSLLVLLFISVSWLTPASATAQGFEVVGTRALGMAGAFVAVADDATATFWNPAGLASGPVFDLVVENQRTETAESRDRGVRGSSFTIALGTPPLGLAYYRIRTAAALPVTVSGESLASEQLAVRRLSTQHFGATLVQSLATFLTIGTTLKIVRGTAATATVATESIERALDAATELDGQTETTMDLDAGLMAVFGAWRAGLVGRNLREPEFEAPSSDGTASVPMKLSRQVRAGVAYAPRSRPSGTNGPLTLAADLDLRRIETVFGDRRELAIGGEGWWWSGRVGARAGVRFDTLRDQFTEQDPIVAVGFSISPRTGSLVEGQITRGRNRLEQGWGISARVTF